MHEQSKAAERRTKDWHYTNLYFVGDGLDIGSGPDGLSRIKHLYPAITSVRDWDLADGDALTLSGITDESLDFISASHVLEHLRDPKTALANWLAALKPHGYMIVTVPDFGMYERGRWPSRHGVGHQHAFTTLGRGLGVLHNINLLLADMAAEYSFCLERLMVLREHFADLPDHIDQSMGPAECAIEFVLRKL